MKKIICIELLHHHECFENPYLLFKQEWFVTKAILWEFVFKRLKGMSEHKDEFFILKQPKRWLFWQLNLFQKIKYIISEFIEIYKNIQQTKHIIQKDKPDALYINTIESPFLIPFMLYLIRLKDIKIYLTIHNIDRLRVHFLKYFLFDSLITSLIKKSHKIILLGKYLKFSDKNIQEKVMYINNRAYKDINVQKFKKKTFVISGTLDYKRKDIESILKWFWVFLENNKTYHSKIKLVLLWQINTQVEEWIETYNLTKIVKTFDHYVWEKDMQHYMSQSHYAIISTYKDSIYGRYKISGAFWDAVAFDVPIILSYNYAPGYKAKNIIRFDNNSFDVLLDTLILK